MAIWIDIIGSFVIGTLLTLNVARLNGDATAQAYQGMLLQSTQSNAAAVARIIEEDVLKMGLDVEGTALTLADTTQIRFLADLGSDGVVDTLNYQISATSAAAHTPNPEDRILYRTINSAPAEEIRLGLTRFRLDYFNAAGDSLTLPLTLDQVHHIRLDLTMESPQPYDQRFAKAFLRLYWSPKNLHL
jgi:hypothetical protein